MGASVSKAESYVNSVLEVGISVVNETVTQGFNPISSTQSISFKDCHGIDMSNIKMEQRATFDISAVTSSKSYTDLDTNVSEKMRSKAESEAKAGFGIANSDSVVITNTVTKLSQAISNATKTMISAASDQVQQISCEDSSDINLRDVDMEQTTNVLMTLVTNSDSVTKAKQECILDVAQETGSKATGFDPTWIIMAIVAIVLVTVLVGPMVLVNTTAKLLTSSAFWMIATGGVSIASLYVMISSWTRTWPGKPDPTGMPETTPEEIAAKQAALAKIMSRNANLRKWGAIVAAISGVGAVVSGYIFIKGTKKMPKILPGVPTPTPTVVA